MCEDVWKGVVCAGVCVCVCVCVGGGMSAVYVCGHACCVSLSVSLSLSLVSLSRSLSFSRHYYESLWPAEDGTTGTGGQPVCGWMEGWVR